MILAESMALVVIGVSLFVMTCGFAFRASRSGVVAILLGFIGVVGSIAYYITYLV